MKTTNAMTLSRRIAVVLCCLLVESLAMCAEAPAPEPKKLKTTDVTTVLGPAREIEVVPEVLLEQPDLQKGLSVNVTLANRGAQPVDLVDPALTARISIETQKGESLLPVVPTPFDEKRLGNGVPAVLRLEPGQEHRFTLSIKEIVRPRPAATKTESAPADSTSATMASSPAVDPHAPPPVAEPLPAGKYQVTLLVSLTQPIKASGEMPPIRLVTTEPFTITYGGQP